MTKTHLDAARGPEANDFIRLPPKWPQYQQERRCGLNETAVQAGKALKYQQYQQYRQYQQESR